MGPCGTVRIGVCKFVPLIWMRFHLSQYGLRILDSILFVCVCGGGGVLLIYFLPFLLQPSVHWQDTQEEEIEAFSFDHQRFVLCYVLVSWSRFPFLFVDGAGEAHCFTLSCQVHPPTGCSHSSSYSFLGVGGGSLKDPLDLGGQASWCWCWWPEVGLEAEWWLANKEVLCVKRIQPPVWGELCLLLVAFPEFHLRCKAWQAAGVFSGDLLCLPISLTASALWTSSTWLLPHGNMGSRYCVWEPCLWM